ncbi:SDR family NAD(P)-dependent oxidoreductase, partial [Candidatus Uhrbacteria bacterium]|nr:SDR family NAD(P)-dependent oxidoreductase [Candidatus Uhrbacteria bacterium]
MSSGLLSNRVAVVCGASRGIGRAIAEVFARAGARVCLVARDAEAVERAAREIAEASGSETYAIAADVGAREVPAALVEAVQG